MKPYCSVCDLYTAISSVLSVPDFPLSSSAYYQISLFSRAMFELMGTEDSGHYVIFTLFFYYQLPTSSKHTRSLRTHEGTYLLQKLRSLAVLFIIMIMVVMMFLFFSHACSLPSSSSALCHHTLLHVH